MGKLPRSRRFSPARLVVVTTGVALLAAALTGARSEAAGAVAPVTERGLVVTAAPTEVEDGDGVRNVVVILADDLDTAAFDQVPRLAALHTQGLTLTNMVATDSLCCPSRASILRSQYVHNHGVLSNLPGSGGGWLTFNQNGAEQDCLPVWLHRAGIHTGYLGKYLNGYGEDGSPVAIPPGWDRWFSPTTKSGMYRGYGYTVNSDGELRTYATSSSDFLPDVLIKESVEYLKDAQSPFYLQINSTAPHDPAPVADRHAGDDLDVHMPRTASFNTTGTDAPAWRQARAAVSEKKIGRLDDYWRQRVQSAESIADTVDAVQTTLRQTGQLDHTLIVVTSDNGYHAVAHRLPPGKRSPYREDTVVPTVLIGPGITPGSTSSLMTSLIDLGPTIAELLGARVPDWTDGRSLVPLFASPEKSTWRTGVISESLGRSTLADPDYQAVTPPKYRALRTERWVFVQYEDGAQELYDRQADPDEVTNLASSVDPSVLTALGSHLDSMTKCGGPTCRSADTWVDPTNAATPEAAAG